jgi:hypothetical protein
MKLLVHITEHVCEDCDKPFVEGQEVALIEHLTFYKGLYCMPCVEKRGWRVD